MDLRTRNAGSNPVLGSALMVLTVLNSQARTCLRQALACAAEHPGAEPQAVGRTRLYALNFAAASRAIAAVAVVALTLVGVDSVAGAASTKSGPKTATIVLQSPTAYTPKAPSGGGTDDYHCTLLNPHLTHNAFITAIDFQPNSAEVHHEITYAVPPDLAAAAEAQNDGGKGWTCFGESGLDAGGAAHVIEWRHTLAHGLGAGAQPLEGTARNRGAHARWDARDHAGALQHARGRQAGPLQAHAHYRAGQHTATPTAPRHRGGAAGHPMRLGRHRADVQQGSGARQRRSTLRSGSGDLGQRIGVAVR